MLVFTFRDYLVVLDQRVVLVPAAMMEQLDYRGMLERGGQLVLVEVLEVPAIPESQGKEEEVEPQVLMERMEPVEMMEPQDEMEYLGHLGHL